jgi:hypothetical protein
MIVSPLLGLVSALTSPPLRSSTSAKLAEISSHPDRFYLYALFITASMWLLVPAVLGLTSMVAERRPRLSLVGGALALFGALVATGDATTELLYWQMGAVGANRGQMVALAHRYETAAGSSLIFALGGLGVIIGFAILAGLLWRTHVAPAWAAVGIPAGVLINVVGFSASSDALVIASNLVLLATLGWIGRLLLNEPGTQQHIVPQPHATTT